MLPPFHLDEMLDTSLGMVYLIAIILATGIRVTMLNQIFGHKLEVDPITESVTKQLPGTIVEV